MKKSLKTKAKLLKPIKDMTRKEEMNSKDYKRALNRKGVKMKKKKKRDKLKK